MTVYSSAFEETPHIAVVVPCYQVEKQIEAVVAGIPSFIKTVILVDDAASDGTPLLVERLAETQPDRIVALHHPENRGVGAATMTGMKHAVSVGADIIVKMDGDGQMNPDSLPDLLEPIFRDQADFTKGNRFTSLDVLHKMPFMRLIGNAGLSFLTRLASGYWNILDPTNGFFAIRGELVTRLNERRIHDRFFFESSLLIELGLLRAVVRDVPTATFYGEESSHLSIGTALREFPLQLFLGFCRRVWLTKFLLSTGPDLILGGLGMILFCFGTFFGLYHWINSIEAGTAATSGTVMVAALPCLLGMQMLLSAVLIDIQSVPNAIICHPFGKRLPFVSGLERKT